MTAEPVWRIYFDSPYLEKQQLSVIAGRPVDVRCTAVGGNPPPHLDVYLDWFNVTRLFDLRRSFRLRRRTDDGDDGVTERGLRAMDVTTVLATRRFVARVRDHALTSLDSAVTRTGPRSLLRQGPLSDKFGLRCPASRTTVSVMSGTTL